MMRGALLGTLLVLLAMGGGAAEQDLSAVFKRLDSLEQQLHDERKDKQGQIDELKARLDQCEAKTSPFIQEMEHRRLQQEEQCRGTGMQTMVASCCSDGGGHRRELQGGCSAFPDTCSPSCAQAFTQFYEGCHEDLIAGMAAAEQAEFDNFYGDCTEAAQQAAAALEGASPAMIFHVVVVDQEAEQQAAMANGDGGSGSDLSQFGPVNLPPTPSPPSDASGAVAAQEFRRVCTTVNLATCVPECNAVTYGFLLSIEIDGRGTVMTCNVMNMLYAWVGQASLGGYIGAIFEAFFSSVISGAAGTYMVTLTGNQTVHTDLTIQPGQVVVINGDRALPHPPTWGSGGFTVGESASLSLSYMQIDTLIEIDEGAPQLSFDECLLTFTNALVLQPGLSLAMKSTTLTSTETMLLRDGMHATFIGMDAQFRGNPSWVVTKSGETATGQVCDVDGTNCVEDLCALVDCNGGDTGGLNPGGTGCVSPQGSCVCGDPQGHGYSGDRCETHTCCGSGRYRGNGCDMCCCGSCVSMAGCDANWPGWDAHCDRTC
eukprot:SAG22_NODE_937_length_6418_cov_124.858680_6_plen_543_part_00